MKSTLTRNDTGCKQVAHCCKASSSFLIDYSNRQVETRESSGGGQCVEEYLLIIASIDSFHNYPKYLQTT